MSNAKPSSGSKNRSRLLQNIAFIGMIVVPVFLFFAAEAHSLVLVLVLLLAEAIAMAVSMAVS